MRWSSTKIAGFRRGLRVSAALLLATAALAGLSIQSVYREAQVRRRLVADTHRSIADVVSARLDAAMMEADRTAAADLQSVEPNAEVLLQKFEELEASRPWLQLLVVVSTGGTNDDPPDETFTAAERAEYREQAYGRAATLYANAAEHAGGVTRRAAALNGEARSELKAGNSDRAAAAYRKLIAETDTLDRESAQLSLVARDQLVSCYRILRRETDARAAALDLYRFLLRHRFILDEDTYGFYKMHVPADLAAPFRGREQQLDSIAPAVHANSGTVIQTIAGGAEVIHVWTISNARELLRRSLASAGLWTGVPFGIVEDGENPNAVRATAPLVRGPHWRIAAFPEPGSMDAFASREVAGFAALLILVVGTVVTAMVLAARSVARELALSQMRSDFVASVSHELKTPLSLIRMFAESLREGWVSESKRDGYYEVITRESERLTGLIDNVLDFSRIESGTRKYRRATADLREILANLLDRYQYHLNAAHIELIQELPAGPVYALVDPEAIEQVLVNLLSNAVKYMGDADRQPRRVAVSLAATPDHAVIRIEDTGIGIAEEDRVHIFERFWRAGDERVRAVAGSGLGLTLVKHIVDAHDGGIAVESVEGAGSIFAVTLPINAGGAGGAGGQ